MFPETSRRLLCNVEGREGKIEREIERYYNSCTLKRSNVIKGKKERDSHKKIMFYESFTLKCNVDSVEKRERQKDRKKEWKRAKERLCERKKKREINAFTLRMREAVTNL